MRRFRALGIPKPNKNPYKSKTIKTSSPPEIVDYKSLLKLMVFSERPLNYWSLDFQGNGSCHPGWCWASIFAWRGVDSKYSMNLFFTSEYQGAESLCTTLWSCHSYHLFGYGHLSRGEGIVVCISKRQSPSTLTTAFVVNKCSARSYSFLLLLLLPVLSSIIWLLFDVCFFWGGTRTQKATQDIAP